MAIDANKRYKLTGAQIQELATRLVGAEALQPLTGSSAPTLATVGVIGQLYVQDDGTVYILKDIEEDSGDESGALAEYIWEEFGAGTEYTAGDGISILNDVISATNTGKAKVLTAADYNYPVNNPSYVALWLLEPGVYDSTDVNIQARMTPSTLARGVSVVGVEGTTVQILTVGINNESIRMYRVSRSTGNEIGHLYIEPIVNNLTSTSTEAPLAANQGRVLNERIGDLTTLETTTKTSAVAAINELAGTVDDIEPQSGSGAPTSSTEGTIGQTYVDTSTGDIYYLSEIVEESGEPDTYVWNKITVGSSITELTSADYNYPASAPNGIATWLLDEGIYKITDATVWVTSGGQSDYRNWVIIVAKKPTVASGTGDGTIVFFPEGYNAYIRDGYLTDGSSSTYYGLAPTVVQSTGTSTTDVMSQNATTSMVYKDPSTRQKIQLGQNAGANGPNAVAVGRETLVAGLCSNGVAIGPSAITQPESGLTTQGQVAIGSGASSHANYAVAIGAGASATTKGQFDISTLGNGSSSTQGYNNSAYRLLTGLYDPQSAHDAATKGYVDTAVGGITVPTAVSQLTNDSGYQTSSDVNSAIAAAVADITSFSYEVVASLPAYGEKGVIYLVASEDSGDPSNVYEEYLWIEDDESGESGPSGYFELIGTTAIDLSGYATTTALAEAIGKAHIITTDDYNYDSNTKVAAWLLSDGVYVVKANPALYLSQATSVANVTIIKGTNSWGTPYAIGISNSGYGTDVKTYNLTNDGSSYGWKGILDSSSIRSNLTTTVNGYALDAEQGKILNDKITGLINKQSSAPTSATTGTVGQIYENTTTGKLYICTEVVEESGEPTSYVWTEVGDGSGVTELTSADYNYHSSGDTDDGVAAWLLADGFYHTGDGVKVYTHNTNANSYAKYLFVQTFNTTRKTVNVISSGSMLVDRPNISDGGINGETWPQYYITDNWITQSTGTSTQAVMSQNATTSMVFADPSTKNQVQIGNGSYAVGTNSVAIGKNADARGSNGTAIGSGSMAWASGTVAIGDNSRASTTTGGGYGATAIGTSANAQGYMGAIALGYYSGYNLSAAGMMDIGSALQNYGYNNSQYRLLTGLYDPQSAHDAATKGYVDTSITSAIGQITGFSYQVVSTLPVSGEKGVIYLVPTEESGDPQNIYEEYIWMIDEEDSGDTGRFELIGTTEMDLSNYATKTYVDEKIGDIETILARLTTGSGIEEES